MLGRNISCFSQAPNSQAVDHTFCCCCCLVSPDKHFGGHQVYVTVFIATLHYMQLCFDKCISQGVRIACVTSCLFSFICVLLLLFCFVLNYPAIQAAACLLRRLLFPFPEGGCCDIRRSELNKRKFNSIQLCNTS